MGAEIAGTGRILVGISAGPPRPDAYKDWEAHLFYDAITNDHGLAFDPFKALIVPRPIGWISSMDRAGNINLAPYSYFNGFSSRPNIVGFSSNGYKDTVSNVCETGEFVCNLATYDLREKVNVTSGEYPHKVNEFELAGLSQAAGVTVAVPRVAESPCAMECRLLQVLPLSDLHGGPTHSWLVIGRVTGVYIDDSLIVDGRVEITRAKPLARLGYHDYAEVCSSFAMMRPDAPEGDRVR